MNEPTIDPGRLHRLVEGVCDGNASEDEYLELDAILAADAEARRHYWDFCRMHIALEVEMQSHRAYQRISKQGVSDTLTLAPWESEALAAPPSSLPSMMSSSPSLGWGNHPAFSYLRSDAMLAYSLAAVVVSVGLAIMSVVPAVQLSQLAVQVPSIVEQHHATDTREPAIGRITKMVNCVWEKPGRNSSKSLLAPVALGDRFTLHSGLMEITYESNAKVILQGPCDYEADSTSGGYLSFGKLTARVEKGPVDGYQKTEKAASGKRSNRPSPNGMGAGRGGDLESKPLVADLATGHSSLAISSSCPLFTIQTPTATVTDLGTEFGVKVDSKGQTTSYVFRGSVRFQAVGAVDRSSAAAQILCENESAITVVDSRKKTHVNRFSGEGVSKTFVRNVPQRIPINVSSTGVGIKEGRPDPNWRIVAASDNSNFKPRQAVVVEGDPAWPRNEPKLWRWISNAGVSAPSKVVFTFQTTFDLVDVRTETARLYVQLMADDSVRALRLNGRSIPLPYRITMYGPSRCFVIDKGFTAGKNTLEIDVLNTGKGRKSSMGMRARITGSVFEK